MAVCVMHFPSSSKLVSFTGGHITYKSVIENLNVLDYEYYFRLTDCFLENKVSDALLLFNDVLNKGFDGSHFITGLSSHFRDLLVSKDAATLALLEVGASIRQRYQEQAQKCPLPFLYRAMKLCNDCDMNYRASKNKRLLVELALIQVAQLTTEGDDVGDGRRPKQAIKPIFTQSWLLLSSHRLFLLHRKLNRFLLSLLRFSNNSSNCNNRRLSNLFLWLGLLRLFHHQQIYLLPD